MQAPVRVGVVQMAMSDTRDDNVARADAFVADAARQGASIVVLPELFADRYFPQRMDTARYALAEEVPGGEVSRCLAQLARSNAVALIGGVYERAVEGRLFNTALAFGPDGSMVGEGDQAWIVLGGDLLPWSPFGYGGRRAMPGSTRVRTLTPPSVIDVIRAGYEPAIHPTA